MNRRNIKCIVMMMVVLGVVHGVFAVPREDGTVKLRDRILFRSWVSPLRRYFPDPEVRRFVRAIVRGRTDRVEQMIEQGMDVDVHGRYGLTPLYVAFLSLNYEIFELLIAEGADIYHKAAEFDPFNLFDFGTKFSDSRYIAALIRRSRELGDREPAFYREIVLFALEWDAPMSTMVTVLESIPRMSLVGSPPYGHPAISAVSYREYNKAALLIDYDPSLFDDEELRSKFMRLLEETQQFDDEFFQARAELVEHLASTYGITVQLQYPEPSER